MLNFSIEPPILTPWLSEEEKEEKIVLLDFQIDKHENDQLRFDIEVAFNPILIPNPISIPSKSSFYVGCTGAEIKLHIQNAKIIEFTVGAILNVKYSNDSSYIRNSTLNLTSALKDLSIKREKTNQIKFSSTFECGERILAPVCMYNTVKWQINLPKGEKAVRDYMLGNLHLNAKCENTENVKSGKIKIKTYDVKLFDNNKEPIDLAKSLLMEFLLLKKISKARNNDHLSITFSKQDYEGK